MMSIKTTILEKTGSILYAHNWGIDRGTIAFCQSDYDFFLTRMGEYLRPSEVALLAYTIVPNEFHLMVRQHVPYGLSAYLKDVCDGYARTVNRLRRRSGHLFQGRYRLRELRDAYAILSTSHHIHTSAVSSGLVENPLDWDHSSLKNYAGVARPSIVDTELVLQLVGGKDRYLQYINEQSDPSSTIKYLCATAHLQACHVTGLSP